MKTILDVCFWVFHEGAFWVFAVTAMAGALMVVISQNVVRMAFWLILSLGATAGLFFSLSADFVGAAQLLVYVGGTLVLLIFGVMLTASGPFINIKTSPGEGVRAAFVGIALLSLILYSACSVNWMNKSQFDPRGQVGAGYNQRAQGNTTHSLGLSLLGARPDKDLGSPNPVLTAGYLLPFEIVSVHLLVVLIGAAYLARAKRRKERPAAP